MRNLADHQNANMVDKAFAEHSAALDGLAVLIWRDELYASQDSFSKLLQITATIVAESPVHVENFRSADGSHRHSGRCACGPL
jgi:hypothetical protein